MPGGNSWTLWRKPEICGAAHLVYGPKINLKTVSYFSEPKSVVHSTRNAPQTHHEPPPKTPRFAPTDLQKPL
jgi:hypothetical protein